MEALAGPRHTAALAVGVVLQSLPLPNWSIGFEALPFETYRGPRSILEQIHRCFHLARATVKVSSGGADAAVASQCFQNMNLETAVDALEIP